jgi:hypothetical protein
MNSDIECLQYAHKNGCPWDYSTTRAAVWFGRIECLKYAYENGCPWDPDTTEEAAEHGNLECLKYAYENGCPWHPDTIRIAAERGYLDCMKYAHENGCPWPMDNDITKVAASEDHVECLIYAHENGCPWHYQTSYAALTRGNLNCFKYAHENGCPWSGHVLTLFGKGVHKTGYYWYLNTVLNGASRIECLKYISINCQSVIYSDDKEIIVKYINTWKEMVDIALDNKLIPLDIKNIIYTLW